MPPPDEHLYSPPHRVFAILRYLVPATVTVGIVINSVVLGVDDLSFFVGLAALYFGFSFGSYYRDRLEGRLAVTLGPLSAEPGNPNYSNDIADRVHMSYSAVLMVAPYAWLFHKL